MKNYCNNTEPEGPMRQRYALADEPTYHLMRQQRDNTAESSNVTLPGGNMQKKDAQKIINVMGNTVFKEGKHKGA